MIVKGGHPTRTRKHTRKHALQKKEKKFNKISKSESRKLFDFGLFEHLSDYVIFYEFFLSFFLSFGRSRLGLLFFKAAYRHRCCILFCSVGMALMICTVEISQDKENDIISCLHTVREERKVRLIRITNYATTTAVSTSGVG